MSQEQCTLKTRVSMEGTGLHTGEKCLMTLGPGQPGTGVVFVTACGEIPAMVANVCDTDRSTSLRVGDAEVRTVEHVLAALAGIGIDNAQVEIDGPEIPAVDGSALPFVRMIEEAGVETQSRDVYAVRVTGAAWATNSHGYLLAVPAADFEVNALVSFQHPLVGQQAVGIRVSRETFLREIAPARTFCMADEIELLRSRGLGRGGTEENVVVVDRDKYSTPLRFPDEIVRHKVLDMIGDLSLVGGRLHADVMGIKASHALNIALVREIVGRCPD